MRNRIFASARAFAVRGALGAAALCAGCATATPAAQPPPAQASPAPQPALKPDPRQELIQAGDQAFVGRANPEELERALESWRKASALGDDAELRVRLARAEHFAGQLAASAEARKQRFERGRQEALQALALASGAPVSDPCSLSPGGQTSVALYWLAENLDAWSREVGLLGSAPQRQRALCLARRLAAADPGYFYAGPLRLLGRLLAQSPTNLGGDARTSKEAFERAIALSPDFWANHVDLAATVAVKLQDASAFESALAKVLEAAAPASEDVAPENALARARAQRLQAEKRTLFK